LVILGVFVTGHEVDFGLGDHQSSPVLVQGVAGVEHLEELVVEVQAFPVLLAPEVAGHLVSEVDALIQVATQKTLVLLQVVEFVDHFLHALVAGFLVVLALDQVRVYEYQAFAAQSKADGCGSLVLDQVVELAKRNFVA